MSLNRTALVLAIAVGSGACATKSDVDRLSSDLAALRVTQDSLGGVILEFQRTTLAALREGQVLVTASRGDLQRQLSDMERQLVQIQELLGQSQIVLRELREQADARPTPGAVAAGGRAVLPGGEDVEGGAPGPGADRSDPPAVLYGAAIEQFRREAYGTARAGFGEFLAAYPADELAPDAQYYLAETYREEGDADQALREYNRVVQLYPNSAAAPTALYKAGLLQVEQGNKDFACEYFQRVLLGFPRSDEARLARDQAEGLNCR